VIHDTFSFKIFLQLIHITVYKSYLFGSGLQILTPDAPAGQPTPIQQPDKDRQAEIEW
jgi:hypothetical protein